ncbi:MAG TPA: 2-phospho-L-lactate guanylyltransferase [Polyangiales bacterium]|nr:2-phospho-L-lactate guanylyltransferase [Polyangiales bacterium]
MSSASDSACRPWAIVPAKAFARAKSRLDGVLAPVARRELARGLLDHVLQACRQSGAFEGILVATDGDDVARSAARAGAQVIRDSSSRDSSVHDSSVRAASLGAIVDAALESSVALGATHALVVMADLPLLEARDVRELVHALRSDCVVLAPDAQRRGTNALGLRLDLGARTCFGQPDSLSRHAREALRVGAALRVIANPRVARDLDTHADWLRWTAVE